MRYLFSLRLHIAAGLLVASCLFVLAVFLLPERRCNANCIPPTLDSWTATLVDVTRIDDGAAVLPESVGVPFSACLSRQDFKADVFLMADCGPMATFTSDWQQQ